MGAARAWDSGGWPGRKPFTRLLMKLKMRVVILAVFLATLALLYVALYWIRPGTTPLHASRAGIRTTYSEYIHRDYSKVNEEPIHTNRIHNSENKNKSQNNQVNMIPTSNNSADGRSAGQMKMKGQSSNISTSMAEDPWKLWQGWVREESFYPEGAFLSGEMWRVLRAMSDSPILKFGVGVRGTQLKASVTLQGGQKAVFKPKRCATVI